MFSLKNRALARGASLLALVGLALSTGCDQTDALFGVAKTAVAASVQQVVTATVSETVSGIVGGALGGAGDQGE